MSEYTHLSFSSTGLRRCWIDRTASGCVLPRFRFASDAVKHLNCGLFLRVSRQCVLHVLLGREQSTCGPHLCLMPPLMRYVHVLTHSQLRSCLHLCRSVVLQALRALDWKPWKSIDHVRQVHGFHFITLLRLAARPIRKFSRKHF